MELGEAVIVSEWDWLAKAGAGAFIGAALMRLWDALKMVSRDDLRLALDDFAKAQIAPLKERQSKSDSTIKDMQHDVAETKETVIRIAAKLDVPIK